MFNQVAYTDGSVVVVHVEHFAAQGALVPDWLGRDRQAEATTGVLAKAGRRLRTEHTTLRRRNATLVRLPQRNEQGYPTLTIRVRGCT